MRKKKSELTFGEEMTPILKEIADAILDRASDDRSIPNYGECAILYALQIFTDVLLDLAFPYWMRLGLTRDQILHNAERLGEEMRMIVLRYGDVDTRRPVGLNIY